VPENHGSYKGKCSLCGCEVATNDKADLKSGYSGMDAQHGFYVDCSTPGCNRQINMESERGI
jgi:hypothetical protein